MENLRRHYAKSCALWTENFEANGEQMRRLAGDKRFRIWHVSLVGCSDAFEQDWISRYQIVCGKAGRQRRCHGRATICTLDAYFCRSAKVFLNLATFGPTTKAQ
ncbi:hypothetical protein AAKU55_002947 [Oxalobacteraceae bacterium GrIS 1.11]